MTNQSKIQPPTKNEVCATLIYQLGEKGIFQLEAFKAYGETDLRSVVSKFKVKHGIELEKEPQPHTTRQGGTVHFKRYFARDEETREKLLELINYLRVKRNATPLDGGL